MIGRRDILLDLDKLVFRTMPLGFMPSFADQNISNACVHNVATRAFNEILRLQNEVAVLRLAEIRRLGT